MAESFTPQRWSEPFAPSPSFPLPERRGPEQEPVLRTALDFLGLLRRHWVVVLGITALAVGAVWYKMRGDLPVYQATAVIRVADRSEALSGRLGAGPSDRPLRPFMDPVLSQVELLKSRGVAEAVVDSEGLRLRALPRWLPPRWASEVTVPPNAPSDTLQLEFGPSNVTARAHGREARAAYGQLLATPNASFIVDRNPGLETATLVILPRSMVVSEIQNGLIGRPRERTDIIDVVYAAADPVLAQRVVNRAVEVFQERSARSAKEESLRRREFIEDQLRRAEDKLAAAQAQHNQFRAREKVYSTQERYKTEQADLVGVEEQRQNLDAQRRTYMALLSDIQTHSNRITDRLSGLVSSPGIAANPLVAQLFGDLIHFRTARDSLTTGTWGARTAKNPDVQKLDTLIASTERNVVSAVQGQIASIDAHMAVLDDRRRGISERMTTLPASEAEEATLLAQVLTYDREAQQLRTELQSAKIAEAAQAGQIQLVDMAEAPGSPIGAGRRAKMLFALIVGLGLGAIAAYVLENKRSVIRRRDDLERAISLPSLALVPQIRSLTGAGTGLLSRGFLPAAGRLIPRWSHNGNGNGHGVAINPSSELVTFSDARSGGAEAYRTLRTNLLFSAAVGALRRLVVTSPGPAEGKSTTAANLAVAFAQQGHRVLLVDCDLRRSRLHKMMEVPQSPGLTNVLVTESSIAEAIKPTRVDGLMVMPSGALPPNPAELLGSARMRTLLDTLAESYDTIILDTPPLLAASDAAIISRMSDGALVVVRAGRTERSALESAIQQLATVGARVLGTVLNDPDAEIPKYAKYYSYYYSREYQYSSNGA